jgi:hypothetical protein
MTKQLMLESMRSWGLGLAKVPIKQPEQGS